MSGKSLSVTLTTINLWRPQSHHSTVRADAIFIFPGINNEVIEYLWTCNELFQITMADSTGDFLSSLLDGERVQGLQFLHLSATPLISKQPLSNPLTAFIDGSIGVSWDVNGQEAPAGDLPLLLPLLLSKGWTAYCCISSQTYLNPRINLITDSMLCSFNDLPVPLSILTLINLPSICF